MVQLQKLSKVVVKPVGATGTFTWETPDVAISTKETYKLVFEAENSGPIEFEVSFTVEGQ